MLEGVVGGQRVHAFLATQYAHLENMHLIVVGHLQAVASLVSLFAPVDIIHANVVGQQQGPV